MMSLAKTAEYVYKNAPADFLEKLAEKFKVIQGGKPAWLGKGLKPSGNLNKPNLQVIQGGQPGPVNLSQGSGMARAGNYPGLARLEGLAMDDRIRETIRWQNKYLSNRFRAPAMPKMPVVPQQASPAKDWIAGKGGFGDVLRDAGGRLANDLPSEVRSAGGRLQQAAKGIYQKLKGFRR